MFARVRPVITQGAKGCRQHGSANNLPPHCPSPPRGCPLGSHQPPQRAHPTPTLRLLTKPPVTTHAPPCARAAPHALRAAPPALRSPHAPLPTRSAPHAQLPFAFPPHLPPPQTVRRSLRNQRLALLPDMLVDALRPPHPPCAKKAALHLRHPRLPRYQVSLQVNCPGQTFLTKQICLLC